MTDAYQTESGLYVAPEQTEKEIPYEYTLADVVEALNNLGDGVVRTYSAVQALAKKIDKIEEEAREMSSPDALMKMAEGFLGKPPELPA